MMLLNYSIVIKNYWVYLGFPMASMEKCAIFHEDPRNSISLIKLGEKVSKGILKARRDRGDNLEIQAGQHVHKNCDLNHIYLIFELIVSSVAKL